MERLTERKRNFDGTGVAVKGLADGLLTPFAGEILTKLADYEDLEERLHKMFGEETTFSLADVVDTLEMRLSEPDKKYPVNARILTYEEADIWDEYRRLEEQGLLLKLPCEIGTTVYAICTCQNVSKILDDELNFATGYYCPYDLYRNCPHTGDNLCEEVAYKKAVFKEEVESFFFQEEKLYIELKYTKYCVAVDEFRKTIFFTREEAEKKLKEMERNGLSRMSDRIECCGTCKYCGEWEHD